MAPPARASAASSHGHGEKPPGDEAGVASGSAGAVVESAKPGAGAVAEGEETGPDRRSPDGTRVCGGVADLDGDASAGAAPAGAAGRDDAGPGCTVDGAGRVGDGAEAGACWRGSAGVVTVPLMVKFSSSRGPTDGDSSAGGGSACWACKAAGAVASAATTANPIPQRKTAFTRSVVLPDSPSNETARQANARQAAALQAQGR